MEPGAFSKFLFVLLVITSCPSIRTLSTGDGDVESSHDEGETRSPRILIPRRSPKRPNELLPTEPDRKESHLLMGGHLRSEATKENERRNRDEAFWDDGLLLSSSGSGKDRKTGGRAEDDEDKKTLAQQVKEGKYGLIQNEIYSEEPKRPGIISYSSNPEVPRDTAKNLGGLDKEEIWLAENHVLVLRGGRFPEHDEAKDHDNKWPPIDDYTAPRRQVKIPAKPKVPPPFPVQLTDDGPIQIIGQNRTDDINGTLYDLSGSSRGFFPGEGPFFPFANNGSGNPSDGNAGKRPNTDGPPGPFYPALPPGAVVVPPPSSSDYDEEDQSIYYPPPYSFVYHPDNASGIPPGPLVPGIILPPPPDFFSQLEEKKSSTKEKYAKRPLTTPLPNTRTSFHVPRKSSTKLYKTSAATPPSTTSKTVHYSNGKSFGRTKWKNSTTQPMEKTTVTFYKPVPVVEITTPLPEKSTTLDSSDYHILPVLGNQVTETSTERNPWKVEGKKSTPIITYYASTIPSSVDQPVEATPSSVKNIVTTRSPSRYPSHASYYFYEESTEKPSTTTPSPPLFYRTTTELPTFFKLEALLEPENKKEFYNVEMTSPEQTTKDYSVKLIDSIIKDPQIFRYSDSGAESSQEKFETPIRSHSPKLLHSEPLFYEPIPTRMPSAKPYYTTPRYYRKPQIGKDFEKPSGRSKPIYQYSFEAAGYSSREDKSQKSLEEKERQRQRQELASYNEYQDIQSINDPYDFGGTSNIPEQPLRQERLPFTINNNKGRFLQTTTPSPIRDTTMASHQMYFTKQDEQLLDDVTKEYFTMFGKKLSGKQLPSTTPIYGKSSVTEKPQVSRYRVNSYVQNSFSAQQPISYTAPNINVHYGDENQDPDRYSLKDDTLVNYKDPLPTVNPDSEFITLVNQPQQRPAIFQQYRTQSRLPVSNQAREYSVQANSRPRPSYGSANDYVHQRVIQQPQRDPSPFVPISDPRNVNPGAYVPRPISLAGDVAVNYRHPRPPINPDAEFINPSPGRVEASPEKPSSYFAYTLPGDGGHFYFLTPQAVGPRQDPNDGYLYSRLRIQESRVPRLLRRRRGPTNV